VGLFDRFRKRREPEPPAPGEPPPPQWLPEPAVIAAMKASMLETGHADDARALTVLGEIEQTLASVFGEQPPLGWSRTPLGTLLHVRVYWVEGAAGPYFHYLGWGLTEIAVKASASAESGFGIELSIKVAAAPDLAPPSHEPIRALKSPLWPVHLLESFAGVAVQTRHPYGHDHWIEGRSKFEPAGFGSPEFATMQHFACCHDERIPEVRTANGPFRYLQLYPIDDVELAEHKRADQERRDANVLARRRERDRDLVVPRLQR
jgi:hypothetical protein